MRHRTLTSETETDRVKTKVRETKQTKVQRNRLPSPVSARRVPSTAPLKLYVVNHARARRTARVILPYQHVARSVTRPRPAARWADEDELLVALASRIAHELCTCYSCDALTWYGSEALTSYLQPFWMALCAVPDARPSVAERLPAREYSHTVLQL